MEPCSHCQMDSRYAEQAIVQTTAQKGLCCLYRQFRIMFKKLCVFDEEHSKTLKTDLSFCFLSYLSSICNQDESNSTCFIHEGHNYCSQFLLILLNSHKQKFMSKIMFFLYYYSLKNVCFIENNYENNGKNLFFRPFYTGIYFLTS